MFTSIDMLVNAPVNTNNIVVTYLLATLVPYVTRVLYRFFTVVWPNFLHRHVMGFFVRRELGEVIGETKASRKYSDDEELIRILLSYVSFLITVASRKGANHNPDDEIYEYAPSLASIPFANYHFMHNPAACNSRTSKKRHAERTVKDCISEYAVLTVPRSRVSLEVEPGLFIQWAGGLDTGTDEGDGEADTADLNAYLFNDLEKKRQCAHLEDEGSIRGPFDHDEDEESSESDDETERMASRLVAEVIKNLPTVVITCHSLSRPERERALRRHRARVRLGLAEPPMKEASVPSMEAAESPGERWMLEPQSRLDAFIARAWRWHVARMRAAKSAEDRYLYYPVMSEIEAGLRQKGALAYGGCGSDHSAAAPNSLNGGRLMEVQRYPLPSEGGKTFASLFFHDKARVLSIMDDFMTGRGKFGVAGSREDMVVLLHGTPGTGKTSLVKAIAHAMKRHVVAIPLGAIQTNSAMADWMNRASVRCKGERSYENMPDQDEDNDDDSCDRYVDEVAKMVTLRPHEVIYLLEDIDAVAVESVLAENSAEDAGTNACAIEKAADEKRGEGEKTGNERDSNSDSEAKEEREKAGDEHESNSDSEAEESDDMLGALASILEECKGDRLSVSGILHILNGIVIPPGRVVVMTSNHPERLDPRLLQPGVVTVYVSMQDLDMELAMELIFHYFPGEIGADDEARIRHILAAAQDGAALAYGEHQADAIRINPSQLEQLCASCAEVSELMALLEAGEHLQSKISLW